MKVSSYGLLLPWYRVLQVQLFEEVNLQSTLHMPGKLYSSLSRNNHHILLGWHLTMELHLPTVMLVGKDIPALFPALILTMRLHVSIFWGSLIRRIAA